jgi:hypothetical protein
MALFVHMAIKFALNNPVFLRWNDRGCPICYRTLDNCIRVVGFVSVEVLGFESSGKANSLRTVSAGTISNNSSKRHTVRIRGQMCTFVLSRLLIGSLPAAAWGYLAVARVDHEPFKVWLFDDLLK